MYPEIRSAQREIIETFNSKSESGIEMIKKICQYHDILPVEEQIADFFHEHKKNLDLAFVGDYLSGPNVENSKVLQAFTANFNFEKQSFTESLRFFLKAFKLPGEAQKIDRLVESFSNAYFQSNVSDDIADADAAYILAFQTIMLNTDLHNPSIAEKDKMTIAGLKKNLRGLNNKGNFGDDFLIKIFEDIKATPFEFNFVETNPGYELSSLAIFKDPTFQKLELLLGSDNIQAQNVFPNIAENITFSVDQPKSWLHHFIGYQGTITLKDNTGKTLVMIQVYKPGIFSKWLFGEHPSVVIQPVYQDHKAQKAINLAATITANFTEPVTNIKATYDYVKSDLEKAYNHQKNSSSFFKTTTEGNAGQEPGYKIKNNFVSDY